MQSRRRTSLAVAMTVLSVVATVLVGAPVAAQDRDVEEIESELETVEDRRDGLAGRLSVTEERLREVTDELAMLRARLADARARLRGLDGQLSLASEEVMDARLREEQAEKNLKTAERLLDVAERELRRQEFALSGQVAATYKYGAAGRGEMFLRVVQEAQDPNDLARGMYQLSSVVAFQDGIVERVEALRAERDQLRDDAAETRQMAEQSREDAAYALDVVKRLRDDAAAVTAAIEQDEAREEAILEDLQADRDTIADLVADVDRRRAALDEELEQARARANGSCPVVGAKVGRDFINDWGFPRSGGRRHQGTDIFADKGTPVVAMHAGSVKQVRRVDRGLGGIYVSVWSGPGEYWYNAHLDSVATGLSAGDPVAAGQVIGTVGNSGNARTTPPHLHIGHYVNGGAVNPYPVLAQACR